MEPNNMLDGKREAPVSSSASASDSRLLDDAKALWQQLRGLAHDQLSLATLEARLAGQSLVTMIAAGVMIGALLISAWLGLMGAAVLWLVSHGVTAGIAMLLAVAANLLFALGLCHMTWRQSRHLLFPATRRSLRPVPPKLQRLEKS
jgi:hypothetical protein